MRHCSTTQLQTIYIWLFCFFLKYDTCFMCVKEHTVRKEQVYIFCLDTLFKRRSSYLKETPLHDKIYSTPSTVMVLRRLPAAITLTHLTQILWLFLQSRVFKSQKCPDQSKWVDSPNLGLALKWIPLEILYNTLFRAYC